MLASNLQISYVPVFFFLPGCHEFKALWLSDNPMFLEPCSVRHHLRGNKGADDEPHHQLGCGKCHAKFFGGDERKQNDSQSEQKSLESSTLDLKFDREDDPLHFYLFNWRCPAVAPSKFQVVLF